ncbi:DUF2142 domain-containing protein [Agromyces albus]|uniref:DUF2142 domain-containing protein n=1 Tax=Agromyces albus TaxID=205332 RepID=UPI00277E86E9|nr:DUF2142 domain-containing protein [Agromyces albus]MDQ0574691.1 hypothetical protein [Agromyces albus]
MPEWRVFLFTWLSFAALTVAWAVATPLGASPDEPSHLIKASAVVRGELIGDATDKPAVTRVDVPEGIAESKGWTCYAFNPTVPASCLDFTEESSGLEPSTTSAGLYQPLYYALVGWPSLFIENTEVAVLAMRTVSALICSAFLAVAFTALMRWSGRFIVGIGFIAAITPMWYFLAGAVNPNALEVASGLALLVVFLAVLKERAALVPRIPDLVVLALSGIVLASSRSMSPLWVAMIGVMALIYAKPARLQELIRMPRVLATVGVIFAGVAAAAAWILWTGTLGSMGNFPGADTSPGTAFATMLTDRAFDPGLIGVFGWLDTFAPPYVYALWWALLFGTVILGLGVARGRKIAGIVVGILGVYLVPAVVQAMSITSTGYIWQGRYALVPLVSVVVFSAVAIADRLGARVPVVRLYVVVAVFVAIGQYLTFSGALSRYAVGVGQEDLLAMYRNPVWAPPLGIVPWVVIAVVAILAILGIVGWVASRGLRTESSDPVAASSTTSSTTRSSTTTPSLATSDR